MPRLIVTKGADENKQFELTGPVVGIGRDAVNSVRLHDTEVSRRHAELRQAENGSWEIVDVGSANGTLLNTRPVRDAVTLAFGDHVQVGQTILVYSPSRNDAPAIPTDLADRIRMVSRPEQGFSSAIIRAVNEDEGSRILARPETVNTPWLRNSLANLSVMYETIQAVSHILDVDELLERIMDLIFKSIGADRGCVLLLDPDTKVPGPKAVRYREGVNRSERITISRTITDHVLRQKEGVLVSDAAADARFNTGASIVRYGIREAICVPMKGRHETVGVIYLDTQTNAREIVARAADTGKFTEDHLTLAIAIAHQAALAVEETRYHQALLQSERLAAVGQTVAVLSHHIKNILQGLRTGTELLQSGISYKDDAMIQQACVTIERNQRKVSDLVLDMLSYSKEREPDIRPMDLNALVEEVLGTVAGRAEQRKVRIDRRLEPGLPTVPADSDGIDRALLNIVSNAIDAVEGRPNARVAVKTELEPDREWVRIVVFDNGPGIEPAVLEDIFKPFVSTKGSKGTGLGLPVSRKIFREHGGDIVARSIVGRGSEFTLRLPLRNTTGSSDSISQTFLDYRPPDMPPAED